MENKSEKEDVSKVKKNDREKSIKFRGEKNVPVLKIAAFLCIISYIIIFLFYLISKNYDVSKCDICKLDVCKCEVCKCDVSKCDLSKL